jgi:peroxiredoxin
MTTKASKQNDFMRNLVRGSIVLALAAAATACSPQSQPASSPVTTSNPFDDTQAEPSILVTEAMGSPHIGDMAPDFDLPDQDGNRVTLASTRGSVVVLAFVASFCPFSKAEQPYLVKLRKDYAGKNVKVIAIGIKEPEADYREYIGRMQMGMPVLRDEGGAVALKFTPPGAQPEFKDRTQALVTSNLVIDPKGQIRFFTVVDTVHFDAKLVHVRRAVDKVLAETHGVKRSESTSSGVQGRNAPAEETHGVKRSESTSSGVQGRNAPAEETHGAKRGESTSSGVQGRNASVEESGS